MQNRTQNELTQFLTKKVSKSLDTPQAITIVYHNSLIFNDKVTIKNATNNQSLEDIVKTQIFNKKA